MRIKKSLKEKKLEENNMNEKKINTWYDDLIWCPSQYYYFFMYKSMMYCIYLRWGIGPWQTLIIKCVDGGFDLSNDVSDTRIIKTPYFVEDELDKLKEYVVPRIDKFMKLWSTSENQIDLKDWEIV